jgi:hypothetical protein
MPASTAEVMGVWLGFRFWCTIGSISLGFLISPLIISTTNVTCGFWVCLLLPIFVLMLNMIAPKLYRLAFWRTVTDIEGCRGQFQSNSPGRSENASQSSRTIVVGRRGECWHGGVLAYAQTTRHRDRCGLCTLGLCTAHCDYNGEHHTLFQVECSR